MDPNQQLWNEKTAAKVIKALEKRRMEASYAATGAQARDEILAMIGDGSSVYRCGSASLNSIGFWDALEGREGVEIINPFTPGTSPEDAWQMRRQGLLADCLVSGTNALTLDGRLVNLDRTGNRVAAMLFGPNKVILAVGMNKIMPDLETAMARVKHLAAPVTANMVKAKTPCTADGTCHDCRTPDRLCNAWSIIEGQLVEGRIHVKLIGETLGY